MPSVLTFPHPDRHDPALCTGLRLLPVGLCSLLLVPAESLCPEDGETGGCFAGIQVRGRGEGIFPGARADGADFLLPRKMVVRADTAWWWWWGWGDAKVNTGCGLFCKSFSISEFWRLHLSVVLIRIPMWHSSCRCESLGIHIYKVRLQTPASHRRHGGLVGTS